MRAWPRIVFLVGVAAAALIAAPPTARAQNKGDSTAKSARREERPAAKSRDDASARRQTLHDARDYIRRAEYAKAAPLLEPLRAASPGNTEVLDYLLRCYVEMKQYSKAIAAGEAGLKEFIGQSAQDSGKRLLVPSFVVQLARAYYLTGQLARVIAQREEAMKGRTPLPGETVALEEFCAEMGGRLLSDKKPKEAAPYLKRATELRPENSDMARQAARAIREANDLPGAIEYLQERLRRFPDDPETMESLGGYLFDAKRYSDAETRFRQLVEKQPDSDRYYDLLLSCMVKQGKTVEAQAALDDALRHLQSSAGNEWRKKRAVERLSAKYQFLSSGDEAFRKRLSDLALAIDHHPNDASLRDQLGDVYLSADHDDLALSEYLVAAYMRGNPSHLLNQARALQRSRPHPDSSHYLEAVIEHFPTCHEIFDLLDQLIRQRTRPDFFRFTFDPPLIEGYKVSEETCRRIIESNAEPAMKARARLRRIWYHYEPLPKDIEHLQQARNEYEAALESGGVPEQFANPAREEIGRIDDQLALYAQSAFISAEMAARKDLNRSNLMRLVELSQYLDPRPEPTLLQGFLEKNPRDYNARMALAAWHWKAGDKERAATLAADVPAGIRNEWANAGHSWARVTP